MNEEKYIAMLLDSLNRQTLKPDEVIVADYSSDETPYIAEEKGAKVIQLSKPGIAYARNEGASHSSGEILVFIDADCMLEDDVLEKCMRIFQPPIHLLHIGVACIPSENPSVEEKRHRSIITHLRLKSWLEGWFMMVDSERFWSIGGFRQFPLKYGVMIHHECKDFGTRFITEYGSESIHYEPSIQVYHSLRRSRRLGFWEAWTPYPIR